LECSCKASNNFSNPEFNKSNAFLCGNKAFGDAAEGTVSSDGENIKNGQYYFNNDTDFSAVFECQLDPTCAATISGE
jgi:hypothetical protein